VKCSKEYDISLHVTSCECGGIIEFVYDSESIGDFFSERKPLPGIMRFHKLLPILDPSRAVICDGGLSGATPLRKSRELATLLGLRDLWFKDETKNFTRSFKARDAVVSLSRFQEIGLSRFVLSSSGNTAAAFCHALSFTRTPMSAFLFLPKSYVVDFPLSRKHVPKVDMSSETYQECIASAKKFSTDSGIPYEGGFGNPCRREGSKTIAFEVAEEALSPDWYVQAISSGSGAYAFYKGYTELRKLGVAEATPRILCVEPETCAPMTNAFQEGCDTLPQRFAVKNPNTVAKALTNGNPAFSYPYVRQAVISSKGNMVKVSEAEIGYALTLMLDTEAIAADPAVGVALAGIVRGVELGILDRDSKILLNLSGGARTIDKGVA